MPFGGPNSERALILLRKRNAEVASRLLTGAGFAAKICDDAGELIAELKVGAGFAVLSEDGATKSEFLEGIEQWMGSQEAWSDFPIIMLTGRSDVPGRNRTAAMRQEKFGNRVQAAHRASNTQLMGLLIRSLHCAGERLVRVPT